MHNASDALLDSTKQTVRKFRPDKCSQNILWGPRDPRIFSGPPTVVQALWGGEKERKKKEKKAPQHINPFNDEFTYVCDRTFVQAHTQNC